MSLHRLHGPAVERYARYVGCNVRGESFNLDFERRLESEVDLEVSGDLSLGLGLGCERSPTPARSTARRVERGVEGARRDRALRLRL